jgi:glycosyltransferase involved in cell wall biosynthesis
MQVLYFHQHFSTTNGSSGTRSYEFAKKMINSGHKVTMVCGSYWLADSGLKSDFKYGYRRGNVDGINVIEFELLYSNNDGFLKRSLTFLRYSLMSLFVLFKIDYDLIFATSTPLTAGIPGIISKIFSKKKFIFEVRDLWPELPRAIGVIKNPFILKFMDILESTTYEYADACIGLAPGIVEGIKKKKPSKIVSMIPNGCDFSLVRKANKSIRVSNDFNLVFSGAHGLANGLDILIKVGKKLKEKSINDVKIILIGDGSEKNRLIEKKQINKLDNIIFKDPMKKSDLFSYLKTEADFGLMVLKNVPAFYYGTSPNKFFDYISLGLPVLNNYPGWVCNMIKENNCGVIVKPDDPDSFVKGILDIKDDKLKIENMKKSAYDLAKNNFDRKILSKEFVNFIENTLY